MREGEISEAFRRQFREDLAAGKTDSLEEYQARWPEHIELIAREHTLLVLETSLGGAGSGSPDPAAPPVRERRIGRYRIIRELGRGGQGVVYLAEDTKLRRRVALKALTSLGHLSDHLLSRFRREAEIASRIDHPGIAAIYDMGAEDGVPYLAMHYVEGESLASKIDRARAASSKEEASAASSRASRDRIAEQVHLIEKTARALHAAHQASVIHRDLKPGNIMVTPEGDPVILDFGLARDLEDPQASMTRSGDLLGTPAYMAPEQIAAQRIHLDRRADVYSLAATLYEFLTLRLPFEAATLEALYQAILTKDPARPRKLNPSISRDLEVVLETALEKDRDRRYTTALDFAEDLRRARVMEPILARPLSPPERVVRWMRRRPAQAAVVGLFAVVAVLAMYLAARWPEIRRGRDERRREAVEEALAEGYLEVGKSSPEKAIEAFRKALALEPGTPEAVGGIALAHLRRGRPAEALDFLEERRDLAAAYPELDWIRADALRGSGRESEAKEIDDGLGDPRTALGCFLLGSREIERGHSGDVEAYRRAVKLFEEAVILSPDARAAYHFELAHAAGHVNDREVAEVVTKALQALWPDSTRGLFWTAYALSGVDSERAIRAYRELVRRMPNESSIRRNLGVALRQAGDPDGAIEALGEAIRLNAESESYHELGIAWVDKGNPEEALKAFEEAVRLKPEYAPAHVSVGLVLQGRGDDEGAIREFREAIRHSPRYGDAHNNLGVSLSDMGDTENAILEFREAMRLGPDSWNPHYGMGNVLRAKGEFEAALEAYREALRRSPDNAAVCSDMVSCLRAMGDLDTALDRCREYLGKMPQSWELQFQLGVVLQARGDLDAAIEALRKSLGQKADSPDVLLTLGVCLRTKGDPEGAERVDRRALELRPAFAEAHCNLGLVLMDLGRFEEALESLRKGHQLGSSKPRWRYPSAEWVARCERSIELERKLKRILSGEVRPPEGAEERMELASVAHSKGLYATAARLQKEAFTEEPELGADPTTNRRYNAACAAARAAAGEGEEGKLLDGPARALWRVQALHWLEADLAALRRLLEEGSLGKEALIGRLGEWKADGDLAGLREEDRLSALEEEERTRCRALWKAVDDLIAGAGGAPTSR